MRIYGALKMGSVIIVFDVVPVQKDQEGAEAVMEKLKSVAISGKGEDSNGVVQSYYANVGAIEVQDFVFGTKKVAATYEVPDASGIQDALSAALEAVDGVETVEVKSVGRPL